jgi:hypothetical protein
MSSGVRTALANAANTVGGLALIPANPSASVTGVFPGCLFTVWEAASLAANVYTPVLLARYNSSAANGVGTAMPYATAIDFGSITQVNNAFTGTIPTITSLTASSLIQFSSDFGGTYAALTTLSMSALKYVGGGISFTANSLTSLSLASLIAVNGNFGPSVNGATSVTLTNLVYIGGGWSLAATSATSIDLSSLQYIIGATNAALNSVTSLSLPAIVSIGNQLAFSSIANMTTFSFGSTLKAVGGNVTMTGGKLNQASVDGILVSLAALDGTGGTTSYNNFTVNLSGGTNSTPSATGLAAKATLVGRGCTVTTN